MQVSDVVNTTILAFWAKRIGAAITLCIVPLVMGCPKPDVEPQSTQVVVREPSIEVPHTRTPWSVVYPGTGIDQSYGNADVALDSKGYVYFTGWNSADLGIPDSSENGKSDKTGIYLIKFSPDGSIAWVRQWNIYAYRWLLQIGADDSIYLAGDYVIESDFGSPGRVDLRTPKGREDAFVIKVREDGSQEWVRTWGSSEWGDGLCPGDDIQVAVATQSGGIMLSGRFSVSMIFEDQDRTAEIQGYGNNIFIMALDKDGILEYMYMVSSRCGAPCVASLALAESGNAYLFCTFEHSIDFALDSSVRSLSVDGFAGFLCSIDKSRRIEWVQVVPAIDGSALVMNDDELIIAAGSPESSVTTGPFSAAKPGQPYIACLGTDGSFKWLTNVGKEGKDYYFYDAVIDEAGSLLVSGMTDSNTGEPSEYAYESYLLRADSAGRPLAQCEFGSEGMDWIRAIAADHDGCDYLAIGFTGTYSFPEGSGLEPVISSYGFDSLLAKSDIKEWRCP